MRYVSSIPPSSADRVLAQPAAEALRGPNDGLMRPSFRLAQRGVRSSRREMNHAPAGNPAIEIKLLGPIEVTIGHDPVALGRRKQRALLALLALNANRVVSTDRLLDALWGERPPPTAPVALYGLVSALRKLLEPDSAGVLVTKAPGYMLALPDDQIDVGRFERLAEEGRRALAAVDAETASARLSEALALW